VKNGWKKGIWIVAIVAIAAIIGAAATPVQAASVNEIRKGETKSYWVAPVGSLTVYYYPNGNGPSVLNTRTSFWAYWLDEQAPQVSVDIYCSSGLPGSKWYWLQRIDVKPWWKSSYPLWLNKGVYKFEMRSSRVAQVTLRVR